MKQYIINNVLNKHSVTLVLGDRDLVVLKVVNEFLNDPDLIEIDSGSRYLINLKNVTCVKVI